MRLDPITYNIEHTRGDYGSITLYLYDVDRSTNPATRTRRVFVEGVDVIKFTVKKTDSSTAPVILTKTINTFDVDGTAVLELLNADTENLTPGEYVYDIQWSSNGKPLTVGPKVFTLNPDLTRGA